MKSPLIKRLDWDSDFFGIEIGKLDLILNSINDINSIKNILDYSDFNMITILVNHDDTIQNNLVKNIGGILYDCKIVLNLNEFKINHISNSNIFSVNPNDFNEKIVELSYQSGEFSRFKKDPKFGENRFKMLYKEWIIKSINKEISIETFAYIENNEIQGIITLGEKNLRGDIGLFAVDIKHRGKSIGKKLIGHALNYFTLKGFQSVQVVTQLDNILAYDFYIKNNFKKESITNIYHLWSN